MGNPSKAGAGASGYIRCLAYHTTSRLPVAGCPVILVGARFPVSILPRVVTELSASLNCCSVIFVRKPPSVVKSALDQTGKNSVRAYVFGFTLSTGHCSARSALRIWAKANSCAAASRFNHLIGWRQYEVGIVRMSKARLPGAPQDVARTTARDPVPAKSCPSDRQR